MPSRFPARVALSLALAAAFALPAAQAAPPDAKIIEAFAKRAVFDEGTLSPDGVHLAVVVPLEDRSVLAVFRRADLKQVGAYNLGPKSLIAGVWWISNQRLLFSVGEKGGFIDTPSDTGELVAMDYNGKNDAFLTGARSFEQQTGTNIRKRDNVDISAQFVARMPGKDDQVIIASTRLALDVTDTMIDRMDVDSGIRTALVRAPVPYARVLADRNGEPRFASGTTRQASHQLHYRAGANTDWVKLNDELESGVREFAIGFNDDESVAYLLRENKTGPSSLVAYTLADGTRKEVLRDPRVDPNRFLHAADLRTLLAVEFRDPRPRWHFLDSARPEARTLKSLTKAFPDHHLRLVDLSADGNFALVSARSDRESGTLYVFDAAAKKADELLVAQPWLDPAAMAPVQAIEVKARDGLPMQALLTLPNGATGKPPLVVVPHGGPYESFDAWEFDSEAQLLAAHGFAVLRVNFRGSGNYGREFVQKGYRQWGGTMQSDLADAVREVAARGLVDGNRVCLYGASYGGYAALMGPVRDPGLYRCAAGYVGVYDLQQTVRGDGDTLFMANKRWLKDAIGTDPAVLAAASPVNLAAQVKVPVFLAAAGRDETVDKRHSESMREALVAAGNPPDWLMFEGEGHGYYTEAHQREFYARLIAFLDKNLKN